MNKTLKKIFITICLTVMLFYVIPAHADFSDTIGDFVNGLVCDHWVPSVREDTEKFVDQKLPGAGKYAGAVVLEAAALFCGDGKSALPTEMFDYNALLNDIRDIFREELQDAFNNDNVHDAYAKINGAIDFLNTSYEGNPDKYWDAIEMARSQFHGALSALEEVVKELVKQNVETKSLVLGPYIAGIGGLISCYQERYWLIRQTSYKEARLDYLETAGTLVQVKIDNLKEWVKDTKKYLRSFATIFNSVDCPDGYQITYTFCGDDFGGLCSEVKCKGDYIQCYTGRYLDPDNTTIDLGMACLDKYDSLEKAEDAITNKLYSLIPTLRAAELAIALWEKSLEGSWMLPIASLPFYRSSSFPLSIPILNISSGVNYTTEQISQKMILASGWSMISLPVLPENPTLSILFPDAVVVYGYEQGKGYIVINRNEKLEVGKGYWILLKQGHTYTLTGEPIKEFALPIRNGWDMVGSCSSPARAITRHGKIDVMYNYSPGAGYKRVPESNNLQSGQGYWVKIRDVVYGYSFSQWLPFEYNWHDTLTLFE